MISRSVTFFFGLRICAKLELAGSRNAWEIRQLLEAEK